MILLIICILWTQLNKAKSNVFCPHHWSITTLWACGSLWRICDGFCARKLLQVLCKIKIIQNSLRIFDRFGLIDRTVSGNLRRVYNTLQELVKSPSDLEDGAFTMHSNQAFKLGKGWLVFQMELISSLLSNALWPGPWFIQLLKSPLP